MLKRHQVLSLILSFLFLISSINLESVHGESNTLQYEKTDNDSEEEFEIKNEDKSKDKGTLENEDILIGEDEETTEEIPTEDEDISEEILTEETPTEELNDKSEETPRKEIKEKLESRVKTKANKVYEYIELDQEVDEDVELPEVLDLEMYEDYIKDTGLAKGSLFSVPPIGALSYDLLDAYVWEGFVWPTSRYDTNKLVGYGDILEAANEKRLYYYMPGQNPSWFRRTNILSAEDFIDMFNNYEDEKFYYITNDQMGEAIEYFGVRDSEHISGLKTTYFTAFRDASNAPITMFIRGYRPYVAEHIVYDENGEKIKTIKTEEKWALDYGMPELIPLEGYELYEGKSTKESLVKEDQQLFIIGYKDSKSLETVDYIKVYGYYEGDKFQEFEDLTKVKNGEIGEIIDLEEIEILEIEGYEYLEIQTDLLDNKLIADESKNIFKIVYDKKELIQYIIKHGFYNGDKFQVFEDGELIKEEEKGFIIDIDSIIKEAPNYSGYKYSKIESSIKDNILNNKTNNIIKLVYIKDGVTPEPETPETEIPDKEIPEKEIPKEKTGEEIILAEDKIPLADSDIEKEKDEIIEIKEDEIPLANKEIEKNENTLKDKINPKTGVINNNIYIGLIISIIGLIYVLAEKKKVN